jgi:hypothetical protein
MITLEDLEALRRQVRRYGQDGPGDWYLYFDGPLFGIRVRLRRVKRHLIMFINRAMNPVSYARKRDAFEWRRDELNVVLAFSGFHIRDDGKVVNSSSESTLDDDAGFIGSFAASHGRIDRYHGALHVAGHFGQPIGFDELAGPQRAGHIFEHFRM